MGRVVLAVLCVGIALGGRAPELEAQSTNGDVGVVPDVVYGHKDGMALTFDVLRPPDPNGAAVLYMVSGGWVSRWVDPSMLARRSFAPLLDRGFTVIAVRHGSAPRYKVPEAEADVRRALGFVRSNAADWGVDPERLGVFGGSAGGHLSLMLGLLPDDEISDSDLETRTVSSGVAAVVAYYPPVDLRPIAGPSERFPALDFPPEQAAAISPILYASADDPPTLLIHGDADDLVHHRNSEVMYTALKDEGVTTEMVIIPGGDHGFTTPAHRVRAQTLMAEWFTRHLGGR